MTTSINKTKSVTMAALTAALIAGPTAAIVGSAGPASAAPSNCKPLLSFQCQQENWGSQTAPSSGSATPSSNPSVSDNALWSGIKSGVGQGFRKILESYDRIPKWVPKGGPVFGIIAGSLEPTPLTDLESRYDGYRERWHWACGYVLVAPGFPSPVYTDSEGVEYYNCNGVIRPALG